MDSSRCEGSAIIAVNSRSSRPIRASMASAVNTRGVVFDVQAQLVTRQRFHGQRVVVELAVGETGDGEVVDPQGCPGVDRVVLVDEQVSKSCS